jgi:glyoxylase-like metal-dependent hydrolase (beta-lactamase superfamily II)
MFPLISAAVQSVISLDRLRWTTCSHVEGDESGALNQWLAAAPNATPAHGQVGCNIWLSDMADRAPRPLKNDEVLDLGGKKVRWLDTPHVPHNWDAGLIYEETTGTLFSSDLFTQVGPCDATTTGDIVAPAIATEKVVPFMPATPQAAPTLRRLAALKPKTIALMHGPSFTGDGAAALEALADYYAVRRSVLRRGLFADRIGERPLQWQLIGMDLEAERGEIAPAHGAIAKADTVEIVGDCALDHSIARSRPATVDIGRDCAPSFGQGHGDHSRGRVEVLKGPERPADVVCLVKLAEGHVPFVG